VFLVVEAAQALSGDMGVDLGCCQGCVAQHHLDCPEIGAVFDKMRCEGVADDVASRIPAESGRHLGD